MRGPLGLEHLATTSPSSKTLCHPSRPAQMSLPPGSLGPPTSPALDGASPGAVTPALLLVVPFRLSLWPSFLLHLAPKGTCHPFALCCVLWLLFSCLCHLSLSSRPLLTLVLPLQCPSPMTLWQIHCRSSRPSSCVSREHSLSLMSHPHTSADSEMRPVMALPTSVALFCVGSDVHISGGGTCPLPHL